MAKTKKSVDTDQVFPKRWADKLPEGWIDTANSMKEDELKKVVFEAVGNIHTIESDRDNDGPLQKAREEAKELGASYREAKGCQQAKINYALFILNGRGVDLDHTEAAD
jgi:hypothetical protein